MGCRGFVAGIGIALAGHIPASGLWLFTLFSFVYFSTPDTLFFITFLIVFLQVVLFFACVGAGVWLIVYRDRGLGLGLLVGWVVGIIGVVLGTLLL